MVLYDWDRFLKFIQNAERPVQLIWAGKPYPEDYGAIDLFNQIMSRIKPFANCAVLTGYELSLSALLKKGADVWLNTPRMYREASGTSGMTAAMNGAINVSMPDGWVPEFAENGKNCYVVQPADNALNNEEKDRQEALTLMDTLEKLVVPAYYDNQAEWLRMIIKAAADVVPAFEAGRMADEYYEKMYKV